MWCVFSLLSIGVGMGKNPIGEACSSGSSFGMANWVVLILYFVIIRRQKLVSAETDDDTTPSEDGKK